MPSLCPCTDSSDTPVMASGKTTIPLVWYRSHFNSTVLLLHKLQRPRSLMLQRQIHYSIFFVIKVCLVCFTPVEYTQWQCLSFCYSPFNGVRAHQYIFRPLRLFSCFHNWHNVPMSPTGGAVTCCGSVDRAACLKSAEKCTKLVCKPSVRNKGISCSPWRSPRYSMQGFFCFFFSLFNFKDANNRNLASFPTSTSTMLFGSCPNVVSDCV